MRFRSPAAGLLLVAAVVYSATLVIAPSGSHWAVPDVWNHAGTATWVRDEDARSRDLDSEMDRKRRRSAACERIALDVCERRISVREALSDFAAFAERDPHWLAEVKERFRSAGHSAAASERAAAAAALRLHLELTLVRLQKSGDAARAALVTACLASFDDEVRELHGAGAIARTEP